MNDASEGFRRYQSDLSAGWNYFRTLWTLVSTKFSLVKRFVSFVVCKKLFGDNLVQLYEALLILTFFIWKNSVFSFFCWYTPYGLALPIAERS